MFKKVNRLNKVEFSEYFRVGKKHNFPHLTIVTKSSPQTKVAVVAGKKVAKSAVRRNTLKRRVYASLRGIYTRNNNLGIFIVVLKPTYNTLPRKVAEEILQESIAEALKGA